jgi:hypothetical protein
MEVTIECFACGEEHEYEIEAGERATRWYPGSGPSAYHLSGECACAKESGDELRYWRRMRERAFTAAEEMLDVSNPFDTLEEMRGER